MYVWSASVPDSLILSLWFCQPSYFYVRHLPCDIWSSKIQTEKSDFSHSPGTLLKARQCITHFLIIIITFVIILNVSNKLKVKVLVAQSCPTLWVPMDCNLPGSFFHVILQAKILEWVAILFSRDLPNPRIKPRPPTMQADSLPSGPPGKPLVTFKRFQKNDHTDF